MVHVITGGPWVGKSVRLAFPTDRDFDARVKKLVTNTHKILKENGVTNVIRLGYSAIDFVTRSSKGIESFFAAESKKTPPKISQNKRGSAVKKKQQAKPSGIKAFLSNESLKFESERSAIYLAQEGDNQHIEVPDKLGPTRLHQHDNSPSDKETLTDEEIARRLHDELNRSPAVKMQARRQTDRDEAIAKKLQSKYDRENAVLSSVEKLETSNNKRKFSKGKAVGGTISKKSKQIDSYFTK